MNRPDIPFQPVLSSLADILGDSYVDAVCRARAALIGEDAGALLAAVRQPVDFLPCALQWHLEGLLDQVGQPIAAGGAPASARGASSRAFDAATRTSAAPLSGLGYYRVGEDGRLYLTAKSEHYHAPLGHAFPGYALLEQARSLGIPNATHNNTRGHIARLLEQELVRAANGIADGGDAALSSILASMEPGCLNRVLNLETGSLAVEAALKMVLARFWRSQEEMPGPPYEGRVPVLLVLGNDEGGLLANYHGTTVLAQTMRGMWPTLGASLRAHDVLRIEAIRPNCIADLHASFERFEGAPFKVAALFHEVVMMNYGARVLTREFLQAAYALCAEHDVPTIVDEIQSCLWAPELFLFREYGLRPTFAAVGKGFPGGEYPASRILFSAAMDNLAQFGALVTNGQEEIASLAYLVTMRWAQANAQATRRIGDYYEARLQCLATRHPDRIAETAGRRHMSSVGFRDLAGARAFASRLNERGLDISVQTYKSSCPPAVLTKLPLIVSPRVVDFVVDRMEEALAGA